MRILLLSAFALALASAPASAHSGLDETNSIFWTLCQTGQSDFCTILITDALAGNPEAQFRLGVLLVTIDSGRESRQIARQLITWAADQGHPGALRALGRRVPPREPDPYEVLMQTLLKEFQARRAPAPRPLREPAPLPAAPRREPLPRYAPPKTQIARAG
jgi:hypothetical protein